MEEDKKQNNNYNYETGAEGNKDDDTEGFAEQIDNKDDDTEGFAEQIDNKDDDGVEAVKVDELDHNNFKPYYGPLTGWVSFLLVLIGNLLVTLVVLLIHNLTSSDALSVESILNQKSILYISLLMSNVVIFLVLFFTIYIKKLDFKEILRLKKPKKGPSIYIFAILGILGINQLVSLILMFVSGIDQSVIEQYEVVTNELFTAITWLDFTLLFLFVGLGAGIFEELLFRGIIQKSFQKKYHPALAIVLSSALFGIMHLNVVQGISGFILGLYLGFIAYKSESIFPSMVAHFTNNLFSLIGIQLLPYIQEYINK